MKLRAVMFVVLCLAASTTLRADDVWEKKSSAEWSEKDAKKILEDSPWANKYTITSGAAISQTSGSGDSFDRETSKEMWYMAQFWSALPMREARVRTMAFQMKYNQMKPAEKQSFDEKAKQYIEAPQDNIVVRVTYGSNVPDFARKMSKYWGEQTLELQKNQIFLVTDGKRVAAVALQMAPGGNEFYLVFPRTVDGQPVMKPEGKLALEMQHPDIAGSSNSPNDLPGVTRTPTGPSAGPQQTTAAQIAGGKNAERIFIQFKPSKMMFHGSPAI